MAVLQELAARGHRVAGQLTQAEATATARFVLDTAGCVLSGRSHPLASRLSRAARSLSGGQPLPARDRVSLAATFAHLDELDAFHTGAAVLPCATVVPVALELARHRSVAGRHLLAAVAAGAEVIIEAGLRFQAPGLYARGWWPAAVFAGLGTAMTASLLLGHDQPTSTQALGHVAAGLGGLLSADQLAAGHYRLVGRAAADGLDAALGADNGLRASSTLLDDPAATALGRHAGQPTAHGQPHLLSSAIKMFACARPLHAAIEALGGLRRGGHDPAHAELVRITLPSATLRFVTAEPRPAGPAEAAASAVCAVAAFFAGRAEDPAFFRALPSASERQGETPRVELASAPELDARFPAHWGARVELVGPTSATATVLDPRGGPGLPWTDAELEAKFLRLASPAWDANSAARWARQCLDLVTADHVAGSWAAQPVLP